MSNNYEDFYNAHMMEGRVCCVAYTLNGDQPVISTHIGDQPLFYIDEEEIIEEEDNLDLEELGLLAEEIQTLKEEIMGLNEDIKRMHVPEKTLNIYAEFSENAESISEEMNFYLNQKEQNTRLNKVLETLKESRLAAAYLDVAEEYNITIAMSEQVENAFYDRRVGTILLYPHMDLNDQILLLSRELRRHWQHRQGVLINPMTFAPENAILINRAQEADLAVSIVRIAWELQLAGNKDVWERVENAPLGDLARSFAREAFANFRTINDGTAAAATFESWFLSERCRAKDKQIIKLMLADYKGYVFDDKQSSGHITDELIANLGKMPFGKNYLSTHVTTISEDPIFNEIRDRSSANFLWFIKFERSFKETEQESVNEGTEDIRHDLLRENGAEHEYSSNNSAIILELSDYRKHQAKKDHAQKNQKTADIIELKRWSHEG